MSQHTKQQKLKRQKIESFKFHSHKKLNQCKKEKNRKKLLIKNMPMVKPSKFSDKGYSELLTVGLGRNRPKREEIGGYKRHVRQTSLIRHGLLVSVIFQLFFFIILSKRIIIIQNFKIRAFVLDLHPISSYYLDYSLQRAFKFARINTKTFN